MRSVQSNITGWHSGAFVTICLLFGVIASAIAGDATWPVLNAGISDVPTVDQRVASPGVYGVILAAERRVTFASMRKARYGCVQTSFGDDAHIMLFRFAPDGGVVAATTLSFHKTWNGQAETWEWILPGTSVAHATRALQTEAALAGGPQIRLVVREWPAGDGATAPGLDAETLSVGDSTSAIGGVDGETLLRVFEPMATAAALEADYRVGPQGEMVVTIELRPLLDACDIRLTAGDRTLEMRHVPHAEIYASLERLYRALAAGPSVVGVTRVGSAAPSRLAATEKAMLLADGGNVRSLDAITGRLLWPVQVNPEKPTVVRGLPLVHADGRVTLVGTDPVFGVLDPLTGEALTTYSGDGVGLSAICLDAAGRVAIARGSALTVHDGATVAWRHTFSAAVTAGPRETGAGLAVLTMDGKLWLLAADGTPRELAAVAPELDELMTADGGVICLVGDRRIYAHAVAGGPIADAEFEDVVKEALPVDTDRVLVWTGNNRLRLLAGGDAKPQALRQWPTWIRGVSVVADGDRRFIAVADMSGRLSLLDPKTLETVREMEMGMDLAGAPQIVHMPVPWPPAPNGRIGSPVATADEVSEDDLLAATIITVRPRRLLALRDRNGFIYLIAPEAL